MESEVRLNALITIIKSVFKGREDVFAVRWEKGGKSGYMPAYSFDPYRFRMHKIKGGTFQNYADKNYLPLTDEQIIKHLKGEQLIGLYPLLKDNTSWFIVADFDKDKWVENCRTFIKICEENSIPAYIERSRSGKGGHVWMFFEKPYPAIKSRHIVISLLEQSCVFSVFDKSSSFDRLFPNQDFLSGKGLGNLIDLPFYKHTWEQGNSCFINADTLEPISDQIKFLETILRIKITDLDILYNHITQIKNLNANISDTKVFSSDKIVIQLNNRVHINRTGLTLSLINFLKEELNFPNTEFLIKKKMGKNTWKIEHYFKFVEEIENEIIIPRGAIGRLLHFCKEHKIEYEFIDKRIKLNSVNFSCNIQLRDYQNSTIQTVLKKDLGIIVAPPGSGKTVVALKIIAEKQQPALIIVHRKQLAEQWIEQIQTFLSIPQIEIGNIRQGKCKIGKKITVATIQSLTKELNNSNSTKIINAFGTIIVDECHHIPAETYTNSIEKLNTYYLYGLTATPFRKYNDGKLIFIHLGEVVSEIKPTNISQQQNARIVIRNTELDIPFNSKTDKFETLSHVLVHDSSRNKLILDDIKHELKDGKKIVIITERKEHIDTLHQYLKQSFETITLSGEDSEKSRTVKWKILKEGNYQVLITTGQFFGEGTDLQNAQCLFLVYPFSFKGKLIQYIGRVQRNEIAPVIYDYRDIKIDYLNKLFLKRNTYYRKLERLLSLFDDEVNESNKNNKDEFTIEQKIKVPIEELEFRFGAFAFKFIVAQMNTELEFEIENSEIRPEFEVLKPYFSKVVKAKNVAINIYAEFQNNKLIAQSAISGDLEKINQKIIESVKFRFVTKDIIGKNFQANSSGNLLDINQIQGNDTTNALLYNTGEELLEDILKTKNVIHYKQLRYLAQKHNRTVLKIRFVLTPFSFVFFLTGKEQYHIVLETLNTEEATYIWHFNKDKATLKNNLKLIDQHLNIIRNEGRQKFLDNPPENFSRIVHDYSDDKKGFIIWKNMLEERLV